MPTVAEQVKLASLIPSDAIISWLVRLLVLVISYPGRLLDNSRSLEYHVNVVTIGPVSTSRVTIAVQLRVVSSPKQ